MLAVSFINPALLPFAALAALPILIYLFNRQRYRPMRWAAMEFVLRAVKSNRRRLRIENLLLLAIRIAIVLLAVLAVARPVARPFGPLAGLADRRQQVCIVLDASYSMGHEPAARSSFERAQRVAEGLVQDLDRGDKLAVVIMADAPRFLYEAPVFIDDAAKARAIRDIQEVELTALPTDAARTLSALAAYMPRFERGAGTGPGATGEGLLPKQVYILTDLQRNAIANDRGLKDPNVGRVAAELERQRAEVTIVDCGTDDAANLAVTRLDAADEVAGVDIPIKITASVKNFGATAAADLSLEFFVDDTLQASPSLALEPGEEREVERFVVFRDKGAHRVHVVLRTDALAVDNTRTLALEAREGVDVVIVDGEDAAEGLTEADYLAAALDPSEEGRTTRDYLLRPQVIPDTAAGDIDLSRNPVVVLANVAALPPDQVDRLEGFVRSGGALLLLMGHQADPSSWNDRAWKDGKGILPVRLESIATTPDEERYHVLDADTFHHGVLRPFVGKNDRSLFGLPRFEAFWRVAWPEGAVDDPALQAIAWFAPRRATASGEAAEPGPAGGAADGGAGPGERSPALIERRLGRGRVLMFTSTSDMDWSNFPTQGAFGYVMLWTRAMTYLADVGTARRNLAVGEPYEAIVPSEDFAAEILLTTPGQDQIEKTLEKLPREEDRFRLTHAQTGRPGAYEVRYHSAAAQPGQAAAERIDWFAVNVDPDEGDLTRLEERELRELIPELKFRLERERGGDRGLRVAERKADENELWRYAMWAVLGLLGLESLVALTFGRKARA